MTLVHEGAPLLLVNLELESRLITGSLLYLYQLDSKAFYLFVVRTLLAPGYQKLTPNILGPQRGLLKDSVPDENQMILFLIYILYYQIPPARQIN